MPECSGEYKSQRVIVGPGNVMEREIGRDELSTKQVLNVEHCVPDVEYVTRS
jgi:hypothetical protein